MSERIGSSSLDTIAHYLDDWYDSLGRQFGPLSRPQRRMLRRLGGERRPRISDLADELGITAAGATRMIDKLEALGLARRHRTPDTDQREVRVELTPQGLQALRRADEVFFERVRASVSHLDEGDVAELERLLARIARPRD